MVQAHNIDIQYNPIFIKFNSAKPPVFVEKQNKDWIYYGENNEYPQYLISLFNRSSKHNAIICGKTRYILGNGWSSEEIINDLTQKAILNKWIKNPNPYENLDELTKKIIFDYELFRGISLEIVWNKKGNKIAEINHIPFSNIRIAKKEDKEAEERYLYSEMWVKETDGFFRPDSKAFTEQDKTQKEYSAYTGEPSKGKQLFYFRAYRYGLNWYPLPEYIAAIPYINLDFEIPNYWLNAIKNGFSAAHLITFFNGIPPNEKKAEIEEEIKQRFSGGENAGKPIINFANDKEHGSEVQTLTQSDIDKQFQILNKTVQEEIFSGHGITNPMLFGIQTEGKLGARNELIESNELFENTYVLNQRNVIEKIINNLLLNTGINGILKLIPSQPIGYDLTDDKIWNILPQSKKYSLIGLKEEKQKEENIILKSLNSISPLVANKIIENLSPNELRNIIGLGKIDGGDEIIKPTTTIQNMTQFSKKENFVSQNEMGECIRRVTDEGKSHEQAVAICINKTHLDIGKFRKIGQPKKKYKILKSREVDFKVDFESEQKFISFSKQEFEDKKKKSDETKIITEPTVEPNENPFNEDLFVKYSYEWRRGFDDSDKDNSREFCKELMKLDKLYTREEIDSLDNGQGLDVWSSRGGWYMNPNTNTPRDNCRHIWKQNLVKAIK